MMPKELLNRAGGSFLEHAVGGDKILQDNISVM
jgi:hypothetical protein